MDAQSRPSHNMTGEVGGSKKKSFLDIAKEHKREIAIGAAAVLSVMAVVLVVKNRATLMATIKPDHIEDVLTNSLENRNNVIPIIYETIHQNIPGDSPIGATIVRGHIRNLPEGWNPSVSKLELAEKFGYCLDEHQTWVNAYKKAAA